MIGFRKKTQQNSQIILGRSKMWKEGRLPENPIWLPRAPCEELRVTQMGEVGRVAGTPEDHYQEKCPNVPGLQKLPREEG